MRVSIFVPPLSKAADNVKRVIDPPVAGAGLLGVAHD